MTTEIIGSDQIFSEPERQVIAAIADATIGQDDSRDMPSASDPQVLAIILDKATHFEARLKADIKLLRSEWDPLAISSSELIEKLDGDPRLRSFSRILTIVIMQSYYQSPQVLGALRLTTRPPFPLGHEVASGDWSLLDPVRKRGAFYRSV